MRRRIGFSYYKWIKAKLHANRASELHASYQPESSDESVQLVGRAIALSLPVLEADPRELARQLFGRLGCLKDEAAAKLAAAARADGDFSPAPRWPNLTPPGAERLRMIGHEGAVAT